jgi:hypothetical protein
MFMTILIQHISQQITQHVYLSLVDVDATTADLVWRFFLCQSEYSIEPTLIPTAKRPSQKPTTMPIIAMPSDGTTLIPVTESRTSDLPTRTGTPTRVITHLRNEVVKLQELGLLDQMNQSLPLGQ